jgi:hypothetical protein
LPDGEWISGEEQKIFFLGESRSWSVPGAIDLLVVHPEVMEEKDHLRQNLFETLQ